MPVYSSAKLPGIGCDLIVRPGDLHCEEVPCRKPDGTGEHWWVLVRKTDIATSQVIKAVARAAAIPVELVSYTASRDRRGTCQQWFSIPAASIDTPGVLKNIGYQSKIRTIRVVAHPKPIAAVGIENLQWRVRLRVGGGAAAYQKAKPILDHLRRHGVPNFIPRELFGRNGEWPRWGRMVAAGERLPRRVAAAAPVGRCLWALQAWMFNRWLEQRINDDLLGSAVLGDCLIGAKGKPELVTDAAHASRRLDSFESNILGPMFGHGMSPVEGDALAREEELLATVGLSASQVARLRGSRRAMRYQPTKATLDIHGDDLILQTELPVDANIQVIIDEMVKPGSADVNSADSAENVTRSDGDDVEGPNGKDEDDERAEILAAIREMRDGPQ